MPGTTRAGGYRTLLARPGVVRTTTSAAVGRLGYAMLPLLLLLTVRDGSGSIATATVAMSAFGLAALAMPLKGRLVDRHGQARTLPAMAGTTAALLAAVAVAAVAHRPAPWVLLAAAAGLAAPPLGPAARAQWRVAAPDALDAAYALDATVEETLWLVGPAVAGLLVAAGHPATGVLLAASALVVGATSLAVSPFRPPAAPTSPAAARPATTPARPGLWPVLLTMLGTGAAGSLLVTGVAAVADARGERPLAAVAEVALGAGGVAGGLAWGRVRHRSGPRTPAVVLLGCWAVATAVVAPLGANPLCVVALAVAGATAAPVWVLAYRAADDAVPAGERTEASTWVTTSANLGSAAGTAAAGLLVGHADPLLGPPLVATATALATALAWPATRTDGPGAGTR